MGVDWMGRVPNTTQFEIASYEFVRKQTCANDSGYQTIFRSIKANMDWPVQIFSYFWMQLILAFFKKFLKGQKAPLTWILSLTVQNELF